MSELAQRLWTRNQSILVDRIKALEQCAEIWESIIEMEESATYRKAASELRLKLREDQTPPLGL